jgi:hypothetical protein
MGQNTSVLLFDTGSAACMSREVAAGRGKMAPVVPDHAHKGGLGGIAASQHNIGVTVLTRLGLDLGATQAAPAQRTSIA